MSRDARYTQDEVNAILRRALERSELAGEVSHNDLVATAQEVGIPPAELEIAIAEERRERELSLERDLWMEKRRARLRGQVGAWALVNAICVFVSYLMLHQSWFLWVLVPWGLVIATQALATSGGPSRRRLERMRERRLRRMRQDELRARVRGGAKVIGDAVEQGVSALLERLEESRQGRRHESRHLGGGRFDRGALRGREDHRGDDRSHGHGDGDGRPGGDPRRRDR